MHVLDIIRLDFDAEIGIVLVLFVLILSEHAGLLQVVLVLNSSPVIDQCYIMGASPLPACLYLVSGA